MGKSNIIKMFQIARLDEWIGDYNSADLVYDDIQRSNDKLSYVLKKTITERKERFPIEKQKIAHVDMFFEGRVAAQQVESRMKLLYKPELLKPRNIHEMPIQPDLVKWKYSASVISKVDNDLRLEIRGYNPDGETPNLYVDIDLPEEMINWEIESDRQFAETDAILLEINTYYEEENTRIYLSIDQWGLLYGSVIVDETYLGDTLIRIHKFLENLSNLLW